MSTKPTNPKGDIQRLIDDGYTVEIQSNCLVVRDVPYLDENLTVREDGVLVDSYPSTDHTFRFSGTPYTTDKKTLHVAGPVSGWNGFDVTSHLSFKKSDGKNIVPYADHYDKVTYYIQVIESHAKHFKSDVGARKYRPINTSGVDEIPFQYQDQNSSRAGINHVNEKLKGHRIAIIGLGGTGSYVLDLVSKSHAAEIHIYDDDMFHTHNAFRAPGAADKETLDNAIKKVDYLHRIYSKMHKGIKIHNYRATPEIVDSEFAPYNFVFVCIDANEHKKELLIKLIEKEIPFIDCGIAVDEVDGSLNGTIRLTTLTKSKNDHIDRRVHCDKPEEDAYRSNIQIAELNALNAALAVIKWKRMVGFYHNHESENHTTYMFNCNSLSNDEKN